MSLLESVDVHSATPADFDAIVTLYRQFLAAEPRLERIRQALVDDPSAVAYLGGDLIAFAYTLPFAPDILEVANILVHARYRNQGLGVVVLRHIERSAAPRYAALVLVNSLLYEPAEGSKRLAGTFYRRMSYQEILATEHSHVYAKRLDC